MDESDFVRSIEEAIKIVEDAYIDDIMNEIDDEKLAYSEAKEIIPFDAYDVAKNLFDYEWKRCTSYTNVTKSLSILNNIDSKVYDIVSVRCWVTDHHVDFGGVFGGFEAAASVIMPYNDEMLANIYLNSLYMKFFNEKEIATVLYHEAKHIEMLKYAVETKSLKEYDVMRLFQIDEKTINDEIRKTELKNAYDTISKKYADVYRYRFENRKKLIKVGYYRPLFELHTALTGIKI